MAVVKISALSDGAPAVATDEVMVARSGTTRKLALSNVIPDGTVTTAKLANAAAAASHLSVLRYVVKR